MASTAAPVATHALKSGPTVNRVERVRRGVVPLMAFLAACLGLACLVNLAEVALELRGLSVVNERFVGWAGVGAGTGICVALLVVAAARRMGAAVPLAVGAASAVFGLALGRAVYGDVQLAFALVMLGLATGALLGGAVCLTLQPPASRRLLTALAWGVPMVAVLPVLDWIALDQPPAKDTLQLALHPPVWPLAVVSVLIVGWSALSLLLEPGDDATSGSSGDKGAEDAWTALFLAALVPTVAVMLLGFEPDISTAWLRPLVIVVSAIAVLGLSFACFSMPSPDVRVGYAAVGVVVFCWPACINLLLLTTRGSAAESRLMLGLTVGAVGAGAALGVWRPPASVVAGLLLLAGGAAGAWALPASHLLLGTPVAVMAFGAAAALLGGVQFGLRTPLGARVIGAVGVSATILGVLLTVPLSWALGGSLPTSAASAGAGARVLLGLTFAAAVLAAGYAATLSGRASGVDGTAPEAGGSS